MKIGILISGRGSNMVALVDAVKNGEIPDSEVAIVISERAVAAGLVKARDRGVETVVIERNGRKREEHDAEIAGELKKRGVELICLAGYMRLLSPAFVQAFPNRIINIHPSLLPAFPGLDAQKQAFKHGVKVTGCTVHFVDEHLDNGPVILQKEVEVLDGDTIDTLSAKILEQEHKVYVEAVRRFVLGRVKGDWIKTIGQSEKENLLKILQIGHDTSMRGEGISLHDALSRTKYRENRKSFGASDLVLLIREHKELVNQWLSYSEDKRTTGGWWISENPLGIGQLGSNEAIQDFDSIEKAVAEYVMRELDFWDSFD